MGDKRHGIDAPRVERLHANDTVGPQGRDDASSPSSGDGGTWAFRSKKCFDSERSGSRVPRLAYSIAVVGVRSRTRSEFLAPTTAREYPSRGTHPSREFVECRCENERGPRLLAGLFLPLFVVIRRSIQPSDKTAAAADSVPVAARSGASAYRCRLADERRCTPPSSAPSSGACRPASC